MLSRSFERFSGVSAILVGIGGFVYAALFAIIVAGEAPRGVRELWFATLMLGAVVSTVVAVALYHRLRETDVSVALLALLLGVAGALGGILHGGSNLSRIIESPGSGVPDVQLDPKGILRYAVAGLALLLIGWLILKGGQLARWLGLLAYAGGAVLVFIYVGRLYDFITPDDKVTLIPPFLFGFVLYPALYIGLGLELLRERSARAVGTP
jgi:hypothetical protein